MPPAINIAGERYGRLVAVRRGGSRKWLFQCDCGVTKEIVHHHVRAGNTRSCGCLHQDPDVRRRVSEGASTHGYSKHPLYPTWLAMHKRCSNPDHAQFADYGGRGITVCSRWSEIANFIEDMGPRPPGYTIERIDNHKGYEPSNCKWATRAEQNGNSRKNRHLTHAGRTMTISEWEREIGLARGSLWARINSGWDTARAIETPARIPCARAL